MTKHRLNNIITLIGFILIIVLHFTINLSLWCLLPLILIHTAIVLYGVLNLDANYFFYTHTKGVNSKKQIALTFDDGPSLQSTELLQLLKEENVKATFFCIGKNIAEYPNIFKQMDTDGHVLGNHSYYHHNNFNLQSAKKVQAELEKTNDIIKQSIGKIPLLFRPPNGVSNPMLAKALKQTTLQSVGWNVRSFDTFYKNPEEIFSRIKDKINNGSIILMHDTMPHTKILVSKLIKYAKEHNYTFVGVDEILNLQAYE
ncbi:MAG: polysaccharide deacetylase family protein [Bacteroidetes bacterium]|nr:polysaccharide deacetylase family protein [Bacteroidota bacterium]MCB9225780.1 polysaccharide deacetylase family protein [Chitinophagales bacterium]